MPSSQILQHRYQIRQLELVAVVEQLELELVGVAPVVVEQLGLGVVGSFVPHFEVDGLVHILE